MISLKMKQIHL